MYVHSSIFCEITASKPSLHYCSVAHEQVQVECICLMAANASTRNAGYCKYTSNYKENSTNIRLESVLCN